MTNEQLVKEKYPNATIALEGEIYVIRVNFGIILGTSETMSNAWTDAYKSVVSSEIIKDKRYLVFGFDQFYPYGGMQDMMCSFDTLDEAINEVIGQHAIDYQQIYDRVEGIQINVPNKKKKETNF